MSLPNTLTVSRIFLTLIFLLLIAQKGMWPKLLAFAVFLIASFTDFYDGYYAKKHNLISDFGKLMDPIADKFLILGAFFVFTQMNIIAGWMFLIILGREVGITIFRLFAVRKGRVLMAEKGGKYKTTSQIFAICFILLFIVLSESTLSQHWSDSVVHGWQSSIHIFMFMTVMLTLISGISCLWNNRELLYD